MKSSKDAFVPKPCTKQPLTIQISSEMLETIDQMSFDFSLSLSAFISQCIDYAIQHLLVPEEQETGQGQ